MYWVISRNNGLPLFLEITEIFLDFGGTAGTPEISVRPGRVVLPTKSVYFQDGEFYQLRTRVQWLLMSLDVRWCKVSMPSADAAVC